MIKMINSRWCLEDDKLISLIKNLFMLNNLSMENNKDILSSASENLKKDFLINLEKKLDKLLNNNFLNNLSNAILSLNILKKLQETWFIKKLDEILNSNWDTYYKLVWLTFMVLSFIYLLTSLLSYLPSLSNSFWVNFLLWLSFLVIFLLSLVGDVLLFFMWYKLFFFRKNIFVVSILFAIVTILNMFLSFYVAPYITFTYITSLSPLFMWFKFNHIGFILEWVIASAIFLAFYIIYLVLILKNKDKFTS